MGTKEEVRKIYAEAIARVNALINGLKASNEQNDEETKKDVEALIVSIETDNGRLQKLVDELERDSEFEKFTIAFFGQTNAGKSTIIEALRILFHEESREKQISQNEAEQRNWREEYLAKCRDVLRGLGEIKRQYMPPRQRKWKLVAAFVVGLILGLIIAA
ncbi:MAG: hypothetical protein IKR48_02550 [Kiritimatiellae bacterium]|nr:hypothetical protein [Kiritimatiellia bacterium]